MANTQVIRMLQKQQAKLERMIARAGESVAAWKGELESLVGAITALSGRTARAVRTAARGRKRGTWKPGGRGRPPKWYLEQKQAKGARKATKTATKPKRKKKASAKQLAAMAKARAALAAKRKAEKSGAG